MQGSTFNRRAWAKRVTVVWVISFLLLEVAFGLAVQGPLDYIRNPDYEKRLMLLRSMKIEAGDRPVVLILGSSRVQQGVRPDIINHEPNQPFVYNFGRAGHGPRHHCIILKRLLRDGIRPESVVLEMAPVQLISPVAPVDEINLLDHSYSDLRASLPFREQPEKKSDEWLRAQILLPCFSYRKHVLAQVLPDWTEADHTHGRWFPKDRYGWLPMNRKSDSPRPTADAIRGAFTESLSDWQIHVLNRKAVEEIANVCHREQIALTILWMPESAAYRSCYSTRSEKNLYEFQQELAGLPGVRVINAREWLSDENCYIDGHHIESEFALLFTRMFVERVLPALHSRPDRTTVLRR